MAERHAYQARVSAELAAAKSGEALNQTLSRRRAEAVRNYLTGKGITAERLSAEGIGMERPVADNSTATGRQQNRRVEIIIGNTQSAPAAGSR